MELTDAALVERSLEGDKASFEGLVLRHQDGVFNLALRMTNSHADAADLAQDTFVRAYRKLRSYKPEYSFRNWVLTICANLTRNRFRREARRRRTEEAHVQERAVSGQAGRSHVYGPLEEAIRSIPEEHRVPLVLKHVEGLSYEEVAGVLSIGVSAAKMRVKRGKDQLVLLLRNARGEAK